MEELPPVFGLLLSAMVDEESGPICFVFPRRGEAARFAAVLYGLVRFADEFPDLAAEYAKSQFRVGQRVRVHPSQHVFEFGGLVEGQQDAFWLHTGPRGRSMGGRRQIPLAEALRLEATTRKNPPGHLDTPLRSPPPAPLDTLLGTTTYGNRGLFKNEVVLLDSRSGFMNFTERTTFAAQGKSTETPRLAQLLPLGTLAESGREDSCWLRPFESSSAAGEPMVAVTRDAELLADFCLTVPTRTKLVIANGLSRLADQEYDSISAVQRLVLFSDCDEDEEIERLGRRGCRFWWVTVEDLATSEDPDTPSDTAFGPIRRWAENHHRLQVHAEPCESAELDGICLRLEALRSAVNDDPEGPVAHLAKRAWALLCDAASRVHPPTNGDCHAAREQLASLRSELERNAAYEAVMAINEATAALENCFAAGGELGTAKGAALERVISQARSAHENCALLARGEHQTAALKQWLQRRGMRRLPVFSPATLPDESYYDRLIFVAWFGFETLQRVAARLTAPTITVVGYSFERRWLLQTRHRLRRRPQVQEVPATEKVRLVAAGARPQFQWPEQATPPAVPPTLPSNEFDIWQFEQRLRAARKDDGARPIITPDSVPARYVNFVGDAYAFLTETHKLSVATNIVTGGARAIQKLPERLIGQLRRGDFVVFPVSGSRELIQDVADKLLGPTANKLRALARTWKDALRRSGMSPDVFYSEAKKLGRQRHRATIRYWFADTSQIGPREQDDLILIALVTGDKQLESQAEDVRLAIARIWGAHQSAGSRLHDALLAKLPQVIGQVEENGTRVDLGDLGAAWIVQVDGVSPSTEMRAPSEVNRLLWEERSRLAIYA